MLRCLSIMVASTLLAATPANAVDYLLTNQSKTFALGNVGITFSFSDIAASDGPSTYTATYYYDAFPDQRYCGGPPGNPRACPTDNVPVLTFESFTATGQPATRTITQGTSTGGVNGFIRFDPGSGGSVIISVAGAPVPEPITWAMMVGGFAVIGTVLRWRKRRPVQVSYAPV